MIFVKEEKKIKDIYFYYLLLINNLPFLSSDKRIDL